MKILYLIRHAKSSWKHSELSDIERPLNKRGERDAPLIGKILKKEGVNPDLLISSPAVRAGKTSGIIAEIINYPKDKILIDEIIYDASSSELLSMVQELDDKYNSVIVIGHNPGFTMLNNYLTNSFIENIPTCGVVGIRFNSSWSKVGNGSGEAFFFIYPKLFIK